jgi:manganese-dependent ADP-ribose/CDP-alcohol diphosphatase
MNEFLIHISHWRKIFLFYLLLYSQVIQSQEKPLFSFGLFTDCQYCDCEVKWNRYYKLSPFKLKECINTFNQNKDLSFVFNLGDFIDHNYNSIDTLLQVLRNIKIPCYNIPGNHDFIDNFRARKTYFKETCIQNKYFAFSYKGWRFIALNGNEISTYSAKLGSSADLFAQKRLSELENKKMPNAKPWNGTLSNKQILWLKKELNKSEIKKEKVILLCHFPIYPLRMETNLWDDSSLVNIINKYPTVKAYFAGHDHSGRIAIDHEILFYTFKGMVDTKTNSYSIISIYNDSIVIRGFGRETGTTFRWKNVSQPNNKNI